MLQHIELPEHCSSSRPLHKHVSCWSLLPCHWAASVAAPAGRHTMQHAVDCQSCSVSLAHASHMAADNSEALLCVAHARMLCSLR